MISINRDVPVSGHDFKVMKYEFGIGQIGSANDNNPEKNFNLFLVFRRKRFFLLSEDSNFVKNIHIDLPLMNDYLPIIKL